MTSKELGGLLFNIGKDLSVERAYVEWSDLIGSLADGRTLGFYWETPKLGERADFNPELEIVDLFLGHPQGRDSKSEWTFSANGAFRTYDEDLNLSSTFLWVLIRKSGDKAYKRLRHVPNEVLEKSKIPVSDPAFTRDVANNVWHLRLSSCHQEFSSRLRALTTWPDESFTLVDSEGGQMQVESNWALSDGLIPKAIKTPYKFK